MRIALSLVLALLSGSAWAETPREQTTLRGHVVPSKPVAQHADETVRILGEDGKSWEVIVEADNYHALHDPKLADRLWEFSGYAREGAQFDVRQLFTIVDGVRHKVTYYCEICHIVSFRPGQCMCCQEEVELQEHVYKP